MILFAFFAYGCNCTHNSITTTSQQTTNSLAIDKCWFVSQREFAGIQMTDENGKKMKNSWLSCNLFLLAADTSKYNYTGLIFDYKTYPLAAMPNIEDDIKVGIQKDIQEPLIIKIGEGKKLMQFKIVGFPDTTFTDNIKITVKGNYNSQTFKQSFNKPVLEIEPELRP